VSNQGAAWPVYYYGATPMSTLTVYVIQKEKHLMACRHQLTKLHYENRRLYDGENMATKAPDAKVYQIHMGVSPNSKRGQ